MAQKAVAQVHMIVALTAFDRPEYLRETLQSLREAVCAEPVILVARVEPSPVQDEVLDLIGTGRGTYVTLNEERLGHVVNVRTVFEDAFAIGERFGEDFVVWLADDLVISRDALLCTAFMRDHFRESLRVISTNLHWPGSAPGHEDYLHVSTYHGFASQGHGTWADRWPLFVEAWEPITTKMIRGIDPPGYVGIDFSIKTLLLNADHPWKHAAPDLARVRSIGYEGGMHATFETLKWDNPRVFADDVDLGNLAYHA